MSETGRRARPADPAHFRTVATTGTNGKSSTTWMVAHVLARAGQVCGRASTLGAELWDGQGFVSMPTFGALVSRLQRESPPVPLALEVTSKALAEGFARSWPAEVGVFTNFTRDHLDYHGSPEHYLAAKAQLFLGLRPGGRPVLNAGDPHAAMIADAIAASGAPVAPAWSYGRGPRASGVALSADSLSLSREGICFRLDSEFAALDGREVTLGVLGEFQVENALGAILALYAIDEDIEEILGGLASFPGVPGRFQVLSRAPLVVVDYAHTPDGLAKTLSTARALVAPGGALRLVFGAGGERDEGKPAPMGAIASERADHVWLTSDNPRREPPARIAQMIEAGRGGRASWRRVDERAAAIAAALVELSPADVVVIAGKGHERTQTVGARALPFDDVEVAHTALGR